MSIAKPVMRNLLEAATKKEIAATFGIATAAGVAWYYAVLNRRKHNYANFYKNYDSEAEFQAMVKLGVFDSVTATGEITAEKWE